MVVAFVKSFLSCRNIEQVIQVIAKESKRLTLNETDSKSKRTPVDAGRPSAGASEADMDSLSERPFGGTRGKRTAHKRVGK